MDFTDSFSQVLEDLSEQAHKWAAFDWAGLGRFISNIIILFRDVVESFYNLKKYKR